MKYKLILLFCVIVVTGFSQDNSPYSRFGIGRLTPQEQPQMRAMGYLSTGYVDSVATNLSNPATLGAKRFAALDIGFSVNRTFQQDANATNNITDGGVSYFAYSFPVNKQQTWGMALGVQPFSTKSYEITTEVIDNNFFREFDGDGNTYRLFLQNGIEPVENLRIGLDAGIFFGTLSDDTYNTYLSGGANSFGRRSQQKLRGFMGKAGAQYTVELPKKTDLTIGTTYQLGNDIDNEIKNEDFFFNVLSSEVTDEGKVNVLNRREFDVEETVTETTLTLPSQFGIGAFMSRQEKWSLGIDAKIGNWDEFEATNNNTDLTFKNAMDLSIGGSFIPKFRNPKKAYQAFEYRYGGHYSQSFINLYDTDIRDYGITLGVSLPIKRSIPGSRVREIPSSIDLGIDIGQYGTLENDLLQEGYIKGSIGMNLNARWFNRNKYD